MTVLRAIGHSMSSANSGGEALEAIMGTPLDLILLDIQMPDMSGIEVAATVRRLEAAGQFDAVNNGRRLNIIAYTAHAMPGDKEQFLAAGMDGYLGKPLRKGMLLDMVEKASAKIQDS